MKIKHDNCKDCQSKCCNAGKDRDFICPGGVSCKVFKKKQPTNADKIRDMSDEEMADFFLDIYEAGIDDESSYEWGVRKNSFIWNEGWLKQPYEG